MQLYAVDNVTDRITDLLLCSVILIPSKNTAFSWSLKLIKMLSMQLKLTEIMSVFHQWSYLEERSSASNQVARISYSYTIQKIFSYSSVDSYSGRVSGIDPCW